MGGGGEGGCLQAMLSQLEKRSTQNVISGVLNETRKILTFVFFVVSISLSTGSSCLLNGLSFPALSNKKIYNRSDYEDFMLCAPGSGSSELDNNLLTDFEDIYTAVWSSYGLRKK